MEVRERCSVMHVNAPSENHRERYGVYVSIPELYFVAQGTAGTFSTADYDGNNSTGVSLPVAPRST